MDSDPSEAVPAIVNSGRVRMLGSESVLRSNDDSRIRRKDVSRGRRAVLWLSDCVTAAVIEDD